jgi:hypothetical protein
LFNNSGILLQRTGASQALFFVLLLLYFSRFAWLVRLALIPPYSLVEMISKSFIALLIVALTSSVIAAPVAPDRQFLLGLVVREGLR